MTLGHVISFTHLSAVKSKTGKSYNIAKIAIESVNITSFGEIYPVMDIFPKWALKISPKR